MSIERIDTMLEDMWRVETPGLVQLSLGNYRALVRGLNIKSEFLKETAHLPDTSVMQISEDGNASIVTDEGGELLEFAI